MDILILYLVLSKPWKCHSYSHLDHHNSGWRWRYIAHHSPLGPSKNPDLVTESELRSFPPSHDFDLDLFRGDPDPGPSPGPSPDCPAMFFDTEAEMDWSWSYLNGSKRPKQPKTMDNRFGIIHDAKCVPKDMRMVLDHFLCSLLNWASVNKVN